MINFHGLKLVLVCGGKYKTRRVPGPRPFTFGEDKMDRGHPPEISHTAKLGLGLTSFSRLNLERVVNIFVDNSKAEVRTGLVQ